MDSLAKTHQFIKVNNGKRCYSLGLLKENNLQETQRFYEELENYIEELKLYNSLVIIISLINYGIKNDDNHFLHSNVYEGCYVSEIPNKDSIDGGVCIVMLQIDSANKEVLNLLIKILQPEDTRENIC